MSIYQEYLKTSIGNILIEADEDAITSIKFIQDGKLLNPNAQKSILTDNCSKQLKEYFAGNRRIFNFPYKFSGTEFQTLVWNEIAKIPYGQTISYKELAERINKPQSLKAVISAVSENNLFLCIPCHRLLGSDNTLVGFAPGLKIKEQLLELEKEPEAYTKYNYLQLQNQRDLPPKNLITGRFLFETGDILFETEADDVLAPHKTHFFPVGIDFSGLSGFSLEANAFMATKYEPINEQQEMVLTFHNASEAFVTKVKLSPNQNLFYFDINDMSFENVYKITIFSKKPLKDIRIRALNVADNLFRYKGQSYFYNTLNSSIKENDYNICFTLNGKSAIEGPVFPDNSSTVFNMTLPKKNTIFMVLKNNSTATRIKLFYKTTQLTAYTEDNCVELKLSRSSDFKAYYFNLSNTPGFKSLQENCKLLQFKLEAVGQGEISIKEYSFEEEKSISENAGTITSCVADNNNIKIKGFVLPNYINEDLYISIYDTSPLDKTNLTDSKNLLITSPLSKATTKTEIDGSASFCISGIHFNEGNTTRLSCQFAAFLENDSTAIPLGERFFIENYYDFEKNPYEFSLLENTVYVTDAPFNAKGDSFSDDTDAIQKAIDAVWKQGGGKVIIPGANNTLYGKRYRITNILLRSRVELHIEKGAILWQSPIFRDYKYVPTYGHNVYAEGIPSYAIHAANLPTIQCYDSEYVKITGFGQIRSMDIGDEENFATSYSSGCTDRIHQVPIGFFKVKNIQLSDFELVRTNNCHIALYSCANIYAGNIKMSEARCTNCDGFDLSKGTHHAILNRNIFVSDGDGVIFSACYNDPRGGLWWKSRLGIHGGTRQIKICHSYINAKNGKALAFIPWGTNDSKYEMQEISGITAFDNTLVGKNTVGVYVDNPFNTMLQFGNTAKSDYSPIKAIRIYGNVYDGIPSLGSVKATDFISDLDLFSSNKFQNNNFCISEIPNLANWSYKINKNKKSISVKSINGQYAGVMQYFREGDTALYQGLHLAAGAHKCIFEIMTGETGAFIFVQNIRTGEILTERHIVSINAFELFEIKFNLSTDSDLFIGLRHPADMTSDLEFTALRKADIESVED